MDIDFDVIKEKYPKSYKKLIKYEKITNKYYYEFCFCDYEKFFWSYNIKLYVLLSNKLGHANKFLHINDYEKHKNNIVLKAFEILEEKENKDVLE